MLPLDVMGLDSLNDTGSMDLLKRLAEKGLLTFTENADAFLANVQSSQDGGAPWGAAVEPALRGMQLDREYDEFGKLTGTFRECEGAPLT